MPAIDIGEYDLTFSDEFNSRSISLTGSGTKWRDTRADWVFDRYSDIGFGHSSFVDPASGYDPFLVKDGVLTITAVPDRTPSGYPGSWESGLLTTQGIFSQTYGYFEIRADFSSLPGAWGAFWLLPDKQIPDANRAGRWQELDIVENYGDNPAGVYSHIHTTDPAPNVNWQRDLQVYSETVDLNGFHTYGLEWTKTSLDFYVDGTFVGSQPTPSDMHGPMHVLTNLAVQNNPGNNADIANVPISMKVDYIRVYSRAEPEAGIPDPAPVAPDITLGSGADELLISISQDAYKGNARYKILVDGRQIGGIQTAQALHSLGDADLVLVKGDWSPGPHKATVVFLNDAWGHSKADRNLYVEEASYNGEEVDHAPHALMRSTYYSFGIVDI